MKEPFGGPDITLTLDQEGVIREAVSSGDLGDESLAAWRGKSFSHTVAPASGQSAEQLISIARRDGGSSSQNIQQRFPSGREAPIEYTVISLGKSRGFVAVGRSLQAIVDLQKRLAEAQQERERDYWKLRDVETRYRAILEASHDAVVLVRPANMRVVEANAEAIRTLKLAPGAEFLANLVAKERRALQAMLEMVRATGRAPAIVVHPESEAPWSLRGSQLGSDAGQFYLFHLSPLGDLQKSEALPVENLFRRWPEAFALVDREGNVKGANDAFLDLAQLGAENAALGQNLRRWLPQPGADAATLLAIVQRQGAVARLRTIFSNDVGAVSEVEISAAGESDNRFVGVLFRRATGEGAGATQASGLRLPEATLEEIVRASIEAIERRGIEEAIAWSSGNRTAAARFLGISRQSLHNKIRKYRIVSA